MDKVINIQICVYDTTLEELGIDSDHYVDMTIRTEDIMALRDTPENDKGEGAIIYTRSGHSFISNMNYRKIRKMVFG